MLKSHIAVDFFTKSLTLTKTFYKKACKVGSPEYQELRLAMSESPNFTIKLIGNDAKRTYGKLTFQRMKEYISTQANSEENLEALERVAKIAETKGAKYPLTKKWFLETFPEYKENAVSEQERLNLDAQSSEQDQSNEAENAIVSLDKAA